jgi:hypothetical protein
MEFRRNRPGAKRTLWASRVFRAGRNQMAHATGTFGCRAVIHVPKRSYESCATNLPTASGLR